MEKIRKILRVLFVVGLFYAAGLGVAWVINGVDAVNAVLDFSKSTAVVSTAIIAFIGLVVKTTLDGFVRLFKWLGISGLVLAIVGFVIWGILALLGYTVLLSYITRIVLVGFCSLMFFILTVFAYGTLTNAKAKSIQNIVTVAFTFVAGIGFLTTGQLLDSYSAAVGDNFTLAGMDGVFDSALMNISGDTSEGFVIIDQEKFKISFINYVYEVATGQETTVQTEGAQALFTLDNVIGLVLNNQTDITENTVSLNLTKEDVAALEVAFADNVVAVTANTAAREANTLALVDAETERDNLNTAILGLQAQSAANLALIEASTDADEIAALQLEQQTLEAALALAQSDLLAVNASIVIINAEIDAAEAAIAQAEADLLALASELALVKEALEDADAALTAQINSLNTQVQTLTDNAVDLTAYSTTAETTLAINNAIAAIDFSVYSTTAEMTTAINDAIAALNIAGYSTTAEMNTAITNAVAGVDLSAYSTTEEMNTAITNAVAAIDLANYSTTAEMDAAIAAAIAEISVSADLDTYVNFDVAVNGTNWQIATQATYTDTNFTIMYYDSNYARTNLTYNKLLMNYHNILFKMKDYINLLENRVVALEGGA